MIGPQKLWMEIRLHVGVFVRDCVQVLVLVDVAVDVEIHAQAAVLVVVDNAVEITVEVVVLNVLDVQGIAA